MKKIRITPHAIKLLTESYVYNYRGILKSPEKSAKKQFDMKRIMDRFEQLEKYLPINLNEVSMLEVGSGAGMFLCYLRLKSIYAFGVEPDELSYKASQTILKENYIPAKVCKKSYGETLPYENNSFDLVVSFNVLEHTQNPQQVLSECFRVLRSDGYLYFSMPNYHSWWEGHYGIPWLPWLSPKLAKYYVKYLFGMEDKYIDTLQFINYKKLKQWADYCGFKILHTGEDIFVDRMKLHEIKEYWAGNPIFKKILGLLKFFKLNNLIACVLVRFKMHYPLVIIAKKP